MVGKTKGQAYTFHKKAPSHCLLANEPADPGICNEAVEGGGGEYLSVEAQY